MQNTQPQNSVFVKWKGQSPSGHCSGQFYLECFRLYDSARKTRQLFTQAHISCETFAFQSLTWLLNFTFVLYTRREKSNFVDSSCGCQFVVSFPNQSIFSTPWLSSLSFKECWCPIIAQRILTVALFAVSGFTFQKNTAQDLFYNLLIIFPCFKSHRMLF